MGIIKLGCLLNLLVTLAILLFLAAAAFGIYCCVVPGTWNRTVDKVAMGWSSTKDKGDRMVDNSWGKVKKGGDHLIDSVPRSGTKQDSDASKGERK